MFLSCLIFCKLSFLLWEESDLLVNGGGQTWVNYQKTDISQVKNLRANSLYNADKKMKTRRSGENQDMQQIYKDFFIPSPEKAKQLLHYKH